jgi:hypothetical protein
VRRIIVSLMLALVVAAITGGAALAALETVDPNTLTPPPPPGAECKQTGNYVICQTFFDEDPVVNKPEFMVSCSTGDRWVYLTETIHREGIRWYSDGLLVKRSGTEHEEGTLSLSPTGEEPTVRLFGHVSWVDYFSTPGDFDSAITYRHGNGFRILLPGGGDLLHGAGLETRLPAEETLHGVARYLIIDEDTNFVSDPEVNAALCAALGDPIPG